MIAMDPPAGSASHPGVPGSGERNPTPSPPAVSAPSPLPPVGLPIDEPPVPLPAEGDCHPPGPDPVLCHHCGRTARNGIACIGMCVADSGY
jgi:hypothetical protein